MDFDIDDFFKIETPQKNYRQVDSDALVKYSSTKKVMKNKSVLVYFGLRKYFPKEIIKLIIKNLRWFKKEMSEFIVMYHRSIDELNKYYEKELIQLTINESIEYWQNEIRENYSELLCNS